MNLLRQDLEWENKEAFLPVRMMNPDFERNKMKALRLIFSKLEVNADISETMKSHITMQLFRVAGPIPENNVDMKYEDLFALFLDPYKKEEDYPYPGVIGVFKPILLDFYQQAGDLVFKKTPAITVNNIAVTTIKETDKNLIPEFSTDFTAFFRLLVTMQYEVPPPVNQITDESTVEQIISAYQAKMKLNITNLSSEPMKKPLSWYTTHATDPSYFNELFEVFSKQNISFSYLFQNLFLSYTQALISTTVPGTFTVADESSATSSALEVRVSDFKVDYITIEKSQSVAILFDFKFTKSSVVISDDEIIRAVNNLENYNLQTGIGNYYIQIIFYYSYTFQDAEKMALSANYRVESINRLYAGKIQYFVIPVFSYADLKSRLTRFLPTIVRYSLTPFDIRLQTPDLNSQDLLKMKASRDFRDPQKGKWGNNPEVNGRSLFAKVSQLGSMRFQVQLQVISTSPNNPLTGKVTFFLHDSFSPDKCTVLAKNGIAEIKYLQAFEAFTVGVSCDNNLTKLELDLNELPNIPEDFRHQVIKPAPVKRKPSSKTKINANEPWELDYWAGELNVLQDTLLGAIKIVGPTVSKVKKYIEEGNKSGPSSF